MTTEGAEIPIEYAYRLWCRPRPDVDVIASLLQPKVSEVFAD